MQCFPCNAFHAMLYSTQQLYLCCAILRLLYSFDLAAASAFCSVERSRSAISWGARANRNFWNLLSFVPSSLVFLPALVGVAAFDGFAAALAYVACCRELSWVAANGMWLRPCSGLRPAAACKIAASMVVQATYCMQPAGALINDIRRDHRPRKSEYTLRDCEGMCNQPFSQVCVGRSSNRLRILRVFEESVRSKEASVVMMQNASGHFGSIYMCGMHVSAVC